MHKGGRSGEFDHDNPRRKPGFSLRQVARSAENRGYPGDDRDVSLFEKKKSFTPYIPSSSDELFCSKFHSRRKSA